MTIGKRLGALLAGAMLLAGPVGAATLPQVTPVQTASDLQPAVSLEAVAAALDANDLDRLQALATDPVLLEQLAATDTDLLIELNLAVARAFAEVGRTREAVAAYNRGLLDIMRFRGQGDISLAQPMEELAALATEPARRADWLEKAFVIRETVWGVANPNLAAYREAVDAARAAAGQKPMLTRTAPADGPSNFDLIDVWYATHRARADALTPAAMFGGQRGPLSYGVTEVSVPRDRAPGTIPRPSIWTLEFRPDPNKHMILNSVTPVSDRDVFFERISKAVGSTERKEVFVFIHGYNTSFEGAAIRTAQIAVDMNLDGAPILYSWPSRASLLGYQADTRTVADQELLNEVADFLTDVAERTGAERVHLVAHSMGNRVLERALDVMASRAPNQPPVFHEIVFAAADVGVDEFEATWPRIQGLGRRFTLYASQRDRALQISQQVNQMQRIGDARNIIVRAGLQTVDTTAASGGLLGHDDFAGGALADFRAVMWLSLAPEKRCVLDQENGAGGMYWAFGGRCPAEEFIEDTALVRTTGSIDKALAALDADMSKAATLARAALLAKRNRLVAMFGITPGA